MKIDHVQVYNIPNALYGMRNPLESWSKSDSAYINGAFFIGEKDKELAQKLIKAGAEHRKFLRQIFDSMNITAPLYWWKEMDTYSTGVTKNSTSTMHTITLSPLNINMFETDDMQPFEVKNLYAIIDKCNEYRQVYLDYKTDRPKIAKQYWKALIRILPNSWLQTRTTTMNYEVLRNIIHQRKNHKLTEWNWFIEQLVNLPYAEEFLFYGNT